MKSYLSFVCSSASEFWICLTYLASFMQQSFVALHLKAKYFGSNFDTSLVARELVAQEMWTFDCNMHLVVSRELFCDPFCRYLRNTSQRRKIEGFPCTTLCSCHIWFEMYWVLVHVIKDLSCVGLAIAKLGWVYTLQGRSHSQKSWGVQSAPASLCLTCSTYAGTKNKIKKP